MAAPRDEAARVVVVANGRDPDSIKIARHYIAARGIPDANLIVLPMATGESITWAGFIAEILDPLRARLAGLGWLEGITSPLLDEFGRRRFVATGHRIEYLVLCRGVPLKIEHNNAWTAVVTNPTLNHGLVVNSASVDSELSVMAMNSTPVNGTIPNPQFRLEPHQRTVLDPVIRVARLDGPTVKSVLDLVDNAIAAERDGLAGRAYLDIGGPHPLGEGWLESIAKKLDEAGFDLDVDREKATLPAYARFDAPALYFGWYSWNLNGPFSTPGFKFPPGAIAVHIHSYSASTLRSETENWCGPLVARGATATLGNVFEPYLQLTHRLDLFFGALADGRTFGDAGYYSTPVLSWQGVLVGDPLYRPFAVPIGDQVPDGRGADVAAALVARKARLLVRDDRHDEALQLARGNFRERPCVAAGILVAEMLASTGDLKGAAGALQFLTMLERIDSRNVGVARHAADLLEKWDAPGQALDVRAAILRSAGFGPADEIVLLEEAIRSAGKAGKPQRAADWERRLSLLKAPPGGGH